MIRCSSGERAFKRPRRVAREPVACAARASFICPQDEAGKSEPMGSTWEENEGGRESST